MNKYLFPRVFIFVNKTTPIASFIIITVLPTVTVDLIVTLASQYI